MYRVRVGADRAFAPATRTWAVFAARCYCTLVPVVTSAAAFDAIAPGKTSAVPIFGIGIDCFLVWICESAARGWCVCVCAGGGGGGAARLGWD